MQSRTSLCLTLAVLALAGQAMQPAQAQSVEDFFKGKTISMIIGGTPGGGFDTLARAIGRHIAKHIPGNPALVAKNMPGAGGTLALDHLYNVADKAVSYTHLTLPTIYSV